MTTLKPLLLICDNDGTLVDSEGAHFTAINAVAQAQGAAPISDDEWWEHCSGKGHSKIWDWLKDRDQRFEIAKDDFIKECGLTYLRDIFNLCAKPNIRSCVELFNKATGIKTPVVSNTNTDVVLKGLQATGLASTLGNVYGADYFDVHNIPKKPKPDSWLHIAKLHGISKDEMHRVIILEDSDGGCESAKKAGAYVVQIGYHPKLKHSAPKSQYADFYIGSAPDELAMFTNNAIAGKVLKAPSV